jgi:hypothetical protein
MKTITKLLVASALAASFAAPALAGEEALIAERNVSNTQQGWAQAYAMASTKSKTANVTWSNASKDLSIAGQ